MYNGVSTDLHGQVHESNDGWRRSEPRGPANESKGRECPKGPPGRGAADVTLDQATVAEVAAVEAVAGF